MLVIRQTATPGSVGGQAYRHVQSIPESTWTIEHDLGFFPNVTVLDSTGREVEAEVDWVDGDSLTVSFYGSNGPVSFAGEAFLS